MVVTKKGPDLRGGSYAEGHEESLDAENDTEDRNSGWPAFTDAFSKCRKSNDISFIIYAKVY